MNVALSQHQKHRFIFWHWLMPSLFTTIGFLTIRILMLDEYIAALFYDGTTWPHKNNWWLSQIIHNTGHKIALAAYLLLFLFWASGKIKGSQRPGIDYALTAIAICIVAINLCKSLLHFPCPWQANITLGVFIPYQWRPDAAGCFPSGHASSGYAWVCFYYVAYRFYPAYKYLFLALAVAIGFVFGAAQQIRGAHFISHDLICVYLCWVVASVLFYVWPPHKNATH
jgi:membrane-associated PAP2 superfamily phosphatase